jgi:hypothetical protein
MDNRIQDEWKKKGQQQGDQPGKIATSPPAGSQLGRQGQSQSQDQHGEQQGGEDRGTNPAGGQHSGTTQPGGQYGNRSDAGTGQQSGQATDSDVTDRDQNRR